MCMGLNSNTVFTYYNLFYVMEKYKALGSFLSVKAIFPLAQTVNTVTYIPQCALYF